MHALKLAQKGNLQQKHTGYLAVEFFLHPQHELVILLINTIQKDLNSSNHLEVTLALTVVCHLINNETVHNVLHLVENKLHHPVPSVRKCAVLTLSHCLQLINSESAYLMAFPKLEKCLTDLDLDVVSVVIPTLHKIIKKLDDDFSYIVDSLLQLLDQILLRRIPHCMNYSDIPAPWLQIEILKLLRHLCSNLENSKKVIPVLKKMLSQTGLYHAVAQAIIYQVLETIACIDADTELVDAAMSSVSLLLKSKEVNMKFMGLEALILIVKKAEANITVTQQDVILNCLKFPDESIQLKTLELMHHLANPANAQAITKKMIEFLDQIKGNKVRDLVEKILQLAEKYKQWHEWYISVVLAVFSKVDNLLTSKDINKILAVLMEDEELKQLAKLHLAKHLRDKNCITSSLVKTYVSISSDPSDFQVIFPILLEIADEDCVVWILVSYIHSMLKHKSSSTEYVETFKMLKDKFQYSYSLDIIIKQVLQIINNTTDMTEINACSKVDPSLSSLDSYVVESMKDSDNLYEPLSLRLSVDRSPLDLISDSFCIVSSGETSSLNCSTSFVLKSPAYTTFSSPSISFQSVSSEMDTSSPTVRKKAIWTKEGRSKSSMLNEESEQKENEDDLFHLFAGVI